jgi:hypothetical protein
LSPQVTHRNVGMVETRRTRSKGPSTEAEAEAPAAKRQRRGNREEEKRSAAAVEERRESEQAGNGGARLSDAWDAFFREHFFFRPPSEFYALYELARSVNEESPLGARRWMRWSVASWTLTWSLRVGMKTRLWRLRAFD